MVGKLRNILYMTGISGLVYAYLQFRRDKQEALTRLRNHSKLTQLATGTAEYIVTGTGKPILFVHGGIGGYEQGPLLQDMLGLDNFQFVTVSRPDYGQTDLSIGGTLTEQAKMMIEVLDHLNIERITVLALSAGGMSALQFALNYPERCNGLILLSAQGPELAVSQPSGFWLRLMDIMMASDFFVWLMTRFGVKVLTYFMGNTSRELERNLDNFVQFIDGMFPASNWRDGTKNDVVQLLNSELLPIEEIRVPTVIIHGTNDVIVPSAVAIDATQRIPESDYIAIEGGTHMMFATHFDEISKLIQEFIESR